MFRDIPSKPQLYLLDSLLMIWLTLFSSMIKFKIACWFFNKIITYIFSSVGPWSQRAIALANASASALTPALMCCV